jgi:two-component system, OmpR family, alkaline phosphatase synthesis response regulator PhoP
MRTILVVDDNQKIVDVLSEYLRTDGFEPIPAPDGMTALALAAAYHPDLALVDIMLPGIDGLELTRRLQREYGMPVILVTARSEEVDRLIGLEVGADDYITKPFSPREVVARVRAVLRRGERAAQAESVTSVGDMVIDRDRRTVSVAGQDAELTRTEFDILSVMAETPGRVFTRLQLLQTASGDAFDGYERTVDAHVKNLRRKLGDDPRAPRFIRTVYGVGYKVDPQ